MFSLRPSAAAVWSVCHGYVRMTAQYPEIPGVVDDTVREEGNAGHWVAHMMGKGYIVTEGTLAPNGLEVTDEMLEGAGVFLDELRTCGVPVYQEMTLPAPWIHELCGGTSDAWAWDAARRILRIWDYKFGYRYVDPFESPQLSIYASAVLEFLKLISDANCGSITVELIIVQPRGYGGDVIKRWRTTVDELRPTLNRLRVAALAVTGENPTLVAGSYCEDCSARHACPALQRASLAALDISAKAIPNDLSPVAAGDALRRLLAAQSYIKAMTSGLQQQLLYAIQQGHVDPHWSIGHGQSRTVWKEGKEAEVIALGKLMGADLAKPMKPVTPVQAKKLLDPAMVDRYSETRSGGRKLIPFNDRSLRKLGIKTP